MGAGPTLNLFESMRQAVYLQRAARAHRLFGAGAALTPAGAFHMATVGGARALGFEDRIGTLEEGKEADFLIMDRGNFEPVGASSETGEELLARLVYRAQTGAVGEAFVRGRLVWPAELPDEVIK